MPSIELEQITTHFAELEAIWDPEGDSEPLHELRSTSHDAPHAPFDSDSSDDSSTSSSSTSSSSSSSLSSAGLFVVLIL
jgi:hypothetical protein